MANKEYVQVELKVRPKGLSTTLLQETYDGSKEPNGDPTLEELEVFIREEAFTGFFAVTV